MKRHLVETIESRKDSMIAALWSNSNYDDDKGSRKTAIEELESNFDETVKAIMFGVPDDEDEQVDESNPFWGASKRGVEKIQTPRNDEGSVREVIDYKSGIDQ